MTSVIGSYPVMDYYYFLERKTFETHVYTAFYMSSNYNLKLKMAEHRFEYLWSTTNKIFTTLNIVNEVNVLSHY